MTRLPVLCGALAALALAAPAVAQDQTTQLLERRAPSIVTVKIVLKTEIQFMGQAQDREQRIQVQGAVVDPSGLIMISNSPISSSRVQEMLSGMMEDEEAGQGLDIKMTPSDIKVVFGNEETEHPAFLAASDARLDLAFIQVSDLGDKTVPAIEFPDESKPAIGQGVVMVSRLNEGYDYAPYYETGTIVGTITKPHKAFIVSAELSGAGLPVFTASGEVLGALTVLSSGMPSEGGGGFMGMMGGGGGNESAYRAFLLPSKQVKELIGRAKERAREASQQGGATPPAQGGGEGEGQ